MAWTKQTACHSTLAEKLINSNLPPRLLQESPLQREGLKSLIVIIMALLHSAKSTTTKKAQIFLSTRCRSSALQGKFCRI
eukprot:CCRYP_007387-RA/>CCRYP_007387-RA protein AED:0.22 eAED:0.22 QI:0/-1/0/1/-1/0/1/0/79